MRTFFNDNRQMGGARHSVRAGVVNPNALVGHGGRRQRPAGSGLPALSGVHLDTVLTPSPRPSGERVGVRGFEPVTIGLLSPALSSLGEEREKTRTVSRCTALPVAPIVF
jgi:hypothetical protein